MNTMQRAGLCGLVLACAAFISPPSNAERIFGTYTASSGQTLEYCMDVPSSLEHVTTAVFYYHGFQDTWSVANQLGDTTTTGEAGCKKDDAHTVMHDIRAADSHNLVVTVTFEYPNDQGFPVLAGAQASLQLQKQLRSDPRFARLQRVVYFGVSMGGAVSGTALSENAKQGGAPISDWVLAEPVTDVRETYRVASGLNQLIGALDPDPGSTVSGIQQDTGQTKPTVEALARRSPFANPKAIADSLRGNTTIVTGAFDAEVSPAQSFKLKMALGSVHSRSHLSIVNQDAPGGTSDFSVPALVCQLLGSTDDVCNQLPGHEDANDPTGPVMKEARKQLLDVVFRTGHFTSGVEMVDPANGTRELLD